MHEEKVNEQNVHHTHGLQILYPYITECLHLPMEHMHHKWGLISDKAFRRSNYVYVTLGD